MYIAGENAQFLNVDPTGTNSRVIDEISHLFLLHVALKGVSGCIKTAKGSVSFS